ncbi:MAG TPA: hypothetical protein VGX76_02870 [Pirellulales bacterium]|jgi:hypothetical protein|nr:hypothetical protein [Pirellulales bacterium]
MHPFRFKLLTLFGFVAVIGVACAALARSSQLWLVAVSALSQASLFYAVLAAAYGRNARRAFWVGFAVVGWGYIVLEWASAAGLPFFAPTAFVTDRLQTLLHAQPTLPTPNYASWTKTPPGPTLPVWNVDDASTDGTPPQLADAPADKAKQASGETERPEPEAEPIPVDAQPADRPVAAEPGAIAKPSAAGPGMIMLGKPGGVAPKLQIIFASPEGMVVAWEVAPGQFDGEPLICPGRYNFPQGAIYRLKLTGIPGREAVESYATLEVRPARPRTEAYMTHNAVPVQFTEEDFDQVISGQCVTKAIFLPDPEFNNLSLDGFETLVSTRLDPGVDPIVEADRRGEIMVIIRMGSDGKSGDACGSGELPSDPGDGAALPPGLTGLIAGPSAPRFAEPFGENPAAPPYAAPYGESPAAPPYSVPPPATSVSVPPPVATVDPEVFMQIAKSLWSPLLGFVGDLVALRLYHRRERQDGQLPKP